MIGESNLQSRVNVQKGITLAPKTITNFIENGLRLYEQELPHGSMRQLGDYIKRWQRWLISGSIDVPADDILYCAPCIPEMLSVNV